MKRPGSRPSPYIQKSMMNLSDMGFDHWFEERAVEFRGRSIARVSAVDRGAYRIRNERNEVPAELAGRYYFHVDSADELPCVGDWVAVQYHSSNAAAIIHGVFPRKTFLRRKFAGADVDFQMIGANIDTAFIVQSCHFDFNMNRMDRYLVMTADGGIEPVVVLTKTDLVSREDLARMIEAFAESGVTARVIALSNVTGIGFDEFRRMVLPGRTYCLLGSSGVGKTTLINRLTGDDALQTQSVSATGEGTHTTARRQLIVLKEGAMLIDTPGMREIGLIGVGDGVDRRYEDILALSKNCRYADCSHTQEPGCAILDAISSGNLSENRYSSYMKIKKESEYYEQSYVDKRKKDKAFGRYIKTVIKQMR